MSTIIHRSIPTAAPKPSRWPGEPGFFYAEPPAEIGNVIEAYSFVRSARSWGAVILSLLLGGAGGFLLAGVAHSIFERGDADFYGTIAAMFLGGPIIAGAAYFLLLRFTPFAAEAVFVGNQGIASHTISRGKQTERVVIFDAAHRPERRIEISRTKAGEIQWPVLFWSGGDKPFEVRVKHMIDIAELAYEDCVTP